MKKFRLLLVFLLVVTFSCSDEDDTIVENGTNPTPNLQQAGSSANDFLSASKYTSLEIEIVYVEGFRPNQQTINNFRNFMQTRINKPGGISITETEIPSPGKAPYDVDEIIAIEKMYRTKYNTPDTLTYFLFVADGGSTKDSGNSLILGTAYRNTSCVLYESSIQVLSNASNEPSRVVLETTVILHELCHLLGLVDFGSPMQNDHEDSEHNSHCENANCLMFWQAETNVMQMVGGSVPQLDANCLADLSANGGK